MLLYRFGQSNEFQKKNKKKSRDIQQMTTHCPKDVFSRSCRMRPEKVLGTSWINFHRTSLGLRLRRHFGTSSGRQIGMSPGSSNRIFRGHLGDVGGVRWRRTSSGRHGEQYLLAGLFIYFNSLKFSSNCRWNFHYI